MSYDPDNPTQAEIKAVSGVLAMAANDDPTAMASGFIMTKMILRALRDANLYADKNGGRAVALLTAIDTGGKAFSRRFVSVDDWRPNDAGSIGLAPNLIKVTSVRIDDGGAVQIAAMA